MTRQHQEGLAFTVDEKGKKNSISGLMHAMSYTVTVRPDHSC